MSVFFLCLFAREVCFECRSRGKKKKKQGRQNCGKRSIRSNKIEHVEANKGERPINHSFMGVVES